MFGKVAIVALFAIFAVPGDANECPHQTLTAKWGSAAVDPDRTNSYFSMPYTYELALQEGWTCAEGAITRTGYAGLVYQNDPRLTLIFNSSTGNIFGVQVAFLATDVANLSSIVDYSTMPGIMKKTINNQDYWTAAFCFEKNDDGSDRLYYREGNVLIEVPSIARDIEEDGTFSKQGCLDGSGIYYSTITADTTAANLFPWQLTVAHGRVVGFWFLVVGTSTPPCDSAPAWFETISGSDVKAVLPDASDCLINAIDQNHALSLNFWITKDPWTTVCKESECPEEHPIISN